MFQVSLTDNLSGEHQKRLDEERYIGVVEPLETPYLLFINLDYIKKKLAGDQVDIPFFAYIYGIGRSRMNPTDGSIPAVPIVIWGVFTSQTSPGKAGFRIEYADQCRYKTQYLSMIVKSLVEGGYTNVGAMVIDRITVKIREYVADDALLSRGRGKLGDTVPFLDPSKLATFITRTNYTKIKKYLAILDGELVVPEDETEDYSLAMGELLYSAFGVEDSELLDNLELEEYYQQIRDDIKKYESSLNMQYIPTRVGDDEVTRLVSELNTLFSKDVAVQRPHRQQGVEFCPAYDECQTESLLTEYCAIYRPKLFEEKTTLI